MLRLAIFVCAYFFCTGISNNISACISPAPTEFAYRIVSALDSAKHFEVVLYKDSAISANFRREKLIASILAFPVPFGFCGLHRIYLGSDPWVPIAYLITGGGGFGLLPLIDFIFIVTADEEKFKSYEGNPHLFMWVE